MTRTFGRLAARDDRDHVIEVAPSGRYRKTWRCAEVLDQRSMPACVGFAWAHWLLSEPIRQWLNPVGIYYSAQFVDEWEGQDYEGTSVRAGAKVLRGYEFIGEFASASTVEVVSETILQDGPVVVGTNWYRGMNAPRDGRLRVRGCLEGGHAYLLVGTDTRRAEVTMLNSWGSEWGDRGRAVLTFEALERLLEEDGECWIGREVKPTWRAGA